MPWSKETMFLSCWWVFWPIGKSLLGAWLWRSGCYSFKTLSILQLCAQCLGFWIEATMAVTLFSYKHSCCLYVNGHVHGLVAWEIPSLGPCSALGKKGGKIGERSEPRGYIWRKKTTSLDHRWARFARRYFFLLDLFPHRRAWSQAREYHHLHMKSSKVCKKTKSPLVLLLFRGQGTEQTTAKWLTAQSTSQTLNPHPPRLPSIQCNLQWWE